MLMDQGSLCEPRIRGKFSQDHGHFDAYHLSRRTMITRDAIALRPCDQNHAHQRNALREEAEDQGKLKATRSLKKGNAGIPCHTASDGVANAIWVVRAQACRATAVLHARGL